MPNSNPFDTFSSVGRNMKGFITDTWDTVGWEVEGKSGLPEHDAAAERLGVEWIARLSYMDIPKQGVFVHVDVQWGHPAFGRVMDAAMGAFTNVDKDAILDVESEQGNFTIPFSEYRKLARMAPDPDDYEHGDQDDEFKADVEALIATIKKTQTASQLIREGTDPKGFDFANRHYEAEEHKHLTTNPPPRPPSDRFLHSTCGLMGEPGVDYVLSYDPAFPLSETGSDAEFFDSENKSGEYDGMIEDWSKHPDQEPVVLCADGHILDGWHRLGLANKLGWETIPAWVVRRGSAGAKSQISGICSEYGVNPPLSGEVNDVAVTELEDAMRQSPGRRALTIKGQRISGLKPIGSRFWFEYHCNESHDSADAELWYHSHQRAEIVSLEGSESPAFTTERQRSEAAMPLSYQIRFDDGSVFTAVEDELLDSPRQFFRPDPPRRIDANPPVQSKFSTQLGYGGIPEGFKIESPAGTTAIGYVSNADFPNDASSPTRGELFLVNVREGQRRRGEGMLISIQALRLMKEHGCSTVNMSAISKGGAAIVDRLIREGYISKAIRTSETGKSEHGIGPREVGENPPVRRLPKWMKSPESMFRWALKNVGDFGEELNDDPNFKKIATQDWRGEMLERFSEYLDIANAARQSGSIKIYRKITLEDSRCLENLKSLLECIDLEEIGHYWSAEEEGAGSFGAPEMGYDVTLRGAVEFDGIDWEHGFTSFCFYPDQWEIAVEHDVNITLTGIENHVIDPPITVNSGSEEGYIHRSMRPADENPPPARFWGKAGAGILFHCTGDDTYLLTLRSESVEQPGTLGIPGGACGEEGMFTGKEGKQIGESQAWVCAMRETKEELSWWPKQKQVAQVVLFQKANFQYQTFIVDIPASEKAEAERSIKLNWENDDHVWMSIPEMVSARKQLHFGMQHVLEQIGV